MGKTPYELFKTEERFEKDEGIILDYGDFGYRIARAGGSNKKFGRLLTQRLKPFRRQMETETFDEDVALGIMIETYADAIILEPLVKGEDGKLSKRGLISEDGQVLEGTKEQLVAQMKALPELFKDIQSQAEKVSLFRASAIKEDSKN